VLQLIDCSLRLLDEQSLKICKQHFFSSSSSFSSPKETFGHGFFVALTANRNLFELFIFRNLFHFIFTLSDSLSFYSLKSASL